MHAQAKADMGAILFNCTQPKHQGLMAELCAAKVLAPWSPELAYTGDVGDGREPASPAGTYVPLDGTNGIGPCGCTVNAAQDATCCRAAVCTACVAAHVLAVALDS